MRERTLLATLTAMQFTHMVDFVMMMPLGPQLMRDLDCSPTAFANLVAAYTLAAGFAAALAASILDRFDRRFLILAIYGGMTAATAACGLVDGYAALMLARIASGACGGLVGAMCFTIIGERIPYQRRAAATGLLMTSFSLASIIGIPIGIFLAHLGHWQTPFLALAGLGGVILIMAGRCLAPMAEHLTTSSRSLTATVHAVFAETNHRRAFVLVVCLTFASFSVIPLLASYLVLNAGISETDVAWFYGIGGVCTFFSGPAIGRLADRFGKHRVFIVTTILSLIPIIICTNLPRVPAVVGIGSGVLFMILMSGRFAPAMALITQAARPDLRGAFQAYNTAVQSLAAGFATQVAGWLVTQDAGQRLIGYNHVGWIAIGASLLSLVAVTRLRGAPLVQTA